MTVRTDCLTTGDDKRRQSYRIDGKGGGGGGFVEILVWGGRDGENLYTYGSDKDFKGDIFLLWVGKVWVRFSWGGHVLRFGNEGPFGRVLEFLGGRYRLSQIHDPSPGKRAALAIQVDAQLLMTTDRNKNHRQPTIAIRLLGYIVYRIRCEAPQALVHTFLMPFRCKMTGPKACLFPRVVVLEAV